MYYTPKPTLGPLLATAVAGPRDWSSADAPIQLRDRRLIRRNQVFSVYLDHLEQAGGRHVIDYLSVVPNTLSEDGIGGVAVLPEHNGELGLVRVYRHPLGCTAWEIRRAFVDPAKNLCDAAPRELREESGIATTTAHLVALGTLAPEPGVIAAPAEIFAAQRCAPAQATREVELGHTEARFFEAGEVAALIARMEIQDPRTSVSYYRTY